MKANVFGCFGFVAGDGAMSAGEEFPQLTGGTPTRKERQQMAAANSSNKSPASTPTRQHAAPRASPASTPERRPAAQQQQHQQQQQQQQRNSPHLSHSSSSNTSNSSSNSRTPSLDDFEQFFVGTASLIGDIDSMKKITKRERKKNSRQRRKKTVRLTPQNLKRASVGRAARAWCAVGHKVLRRVAIV